MKIFDSKADIFNIYVMNKICKKCLIDKDIKDFPIRKGAKDGHRNECNICTALKLKEYSVNYIEKKKEYNKTYIVNKIKNCEASKRWYIKNIDKAKKSCLEYQQKKRKDSPLFKLANNLRGLIRLSFNGKGFKKDSKTENILGCTFEEFKIYMEYQFESWMTWENHGRYTGNYNETWQIDHIIPMCNVSTIEEMYKLNHHTNLRPLCSKVNQYDKGMKIDYINKATI
jgi:hypothetical protein